LSAGGYGFLIVMVTLALRITLPLVPVMVNVNVPVFDRLFVLTVSVDVPEPVNDAGSKLAVVRFGSPVTLSVTAPVKPPIDVTLTV